MDQLHIHKMSVQDGYEALMAIQRDIVCSTAEISLDCHGSLLVQINGLNILRVAAKKLTLTHEPSMVSTRLSLE